MENLREFLINKLATVSKQYDLSKCKETLVIDSALVHKINQKNVLIRNVKEIPLEISPNDGSLYYCIACPNLRCDFIFDHPQDHYPFMLFLEMGRQIAIAISHKYKGVPINNIKNTVDKLDLKIHKFVELDVPLIIGCYDRITKSKASIQIRELQYFWMQNGKLCAESVSSVSIMTPEIYYRYRYNSRRSIKGEEQTDLLTNVDLLQKEKLFT